MTRGFKFSPAAEGLMWKTAAVIVIQGLSGTDLISVELFKYLQPWLIVALSPRVTWTICGAQNSRVALVKGLVGDNGIATGGNQMCACLPV